jgi:hypothetical protein
MLLNFFTKAEHMFLHQADLKCIFHLHSVIMHSFTDEVELQQVVKMHCVLVSLLVLLVHHEIEAWVFKLGVVENADKVLCVLVRVSILLICKKGVDSDLVDRAFFFELLVHLILQLFKIKTSFVGVLEHLVVLVLLHSLLFCGLLLFARHVARRKAYVVLAE